MPRSRFTWTLVILGALLLGTTWIFLSQESVYELNLIDNMVEAPAVGYQAPDFTVPTMTGETFTLSDQRGRPLVLNFWATWCPPCRAEIPFFQAASRKYNGQVTVVGVDDGEPIELVAPFASRLDIAYVIPMDEDGAVSKEYRVHSLPSTFFIDEGGVIRYIHIGVINRAVLEDKIAQLLES